MEPKIPGTARGLGSQASLSVVYIEGTASSQGWMGYRWVTGMAASN